MFTHSSRCLVAILCVWLASIVPARAQWAVIDAPAIVQLIQEVQTMEAALQTAREQLTQSRQALQTMTGGRGMQLLLGGTSRNYLPATWPDVAAAMRGGSTGYTRLSNSIRSAVDANAVLTSQQLAVLSSSDRQHIVTLRQSGALQQALAQEALANASDRFAAIQSLVDAIATAADQKAILDLQARITAELGMLQNEQTKLEILHQATQAQDSVNREQELEQVIAGHGRFEDRFRPVP